MIRLLAILGIAITLQGQAQQAPNILLLVSDDHSVPFLGAYGYPGLKTPRLDQLAAEGILYRNANVTAPQCVLSRAGLMTGRNNVAIRMTRFSSPLPRDVVAYPELLREAGYFTGLVGRNFHLDGVRRNASTAALQDKYQLETFRHRVDFLRVNAHPDSVFGQYAEFLSKVPADKPFFVQVCYSDPHRIFDAKEFEPDPDKVSVPSYWPDTPLLRQDFAGYLGEIQRLDGQIGRLLDDLKRRGLDQNTLVIFIGDNGGALLRGKGTLHRLGLNVPLIIRHPKLVKQGHVSDALVSGEDLAPTILEVAGVKVPDYITGKSLGATFRDASTEIRKYAYAVRGAHGGITLPNNSANFDLGRTIFSKQYKLIYNALWQLPYHPVDFASLPFWQDLKERNAKGLLKAPFDTLLFAPSRPMFQLYDLKTDPEELHNLSGNAAYAAIEKELKELLNEWMIVNEDYLPLPVSE